MRWRRRRSCTPKAPRNSRGLWPANRMVDSYARRRRMNKNAPNNDDPDRNETIVIGSGTASPEAENENWASADGSWVVKWNVPGVGSKPCPEIVPIPSTVTAFEGRGEAME